MRWYRTGLLCGVLLAVLARSPRADVQCDGVDDVLTTGLALSTFVTATAFTVMAWVKTTGGATGGTECRTGDVATGDNGGNVALGRRETNELCGSMYDGTHRTLTVPMTAGWHHIAIRKNGGTFALIIDGVYSGELSPGIGTMADLTQEVKVCSTALGVSADRIAHVRYYAGYVGWWVDVMGKSRLWTTARSEVPPTAFWPLDDCAHGASANGVTFRDLSGNGRHLTGSHGANATGLTCQGNDFLIRPWGIQ